MKKILALGLAATLSAAGVAAFAGCGAEDEFVVGAIYINSQTDTAGYTYAHHNGITKAMEQLKLDAKTQLKIVDNVAEDTETVKKAVDTLVGQGADIVFGISFGYIDALEEKATEYKDIAFSHATGYKSNDKNFNNYFGRIYQARYLAGVVSGLKAKALDANASSYNLGYVSAYTTAYAETCSGINAYALGAQSILGDSVTVKVKKLGEWGNETNEKAYAEDLLTNHGCNIIAQHCDSAQPQIAAAAANKFGCGYNSDMTKDAPKGHLTAPIWNWDVYYNKAISAAKKNFDEYKAQGGNKADYMGKYVETVGGNYYGGLKEGFVDISALNAATVTEDAQKYVDAVKALIVAGTWDVFSGKALTYTVGENGAITVTPVDSVLTKNDNTPAGAVTDAVITGSMDYLVKGVTEV